MDTCMSRMQEYVTHVDADTPSLISSHRMTAGRCHAGTAGKDCHAGLGDAGITPATAQCAPSSVTLATLTGACCRLRARGPSPLSTEPRTWKFVTMLPCTAARVLSTVSVRVAEADARVKAEPEAAPSPPSSADPDADFNPGERYRLTLTLAHVDSI